MAPTVSRRPVLAVAIAAMLLMGCQDATTTARTTAGTPVARPSPSPSPSPAPPPPVVGVVTVRTVDASDPTLLGFEDDGGPDGDRAATVATTVTAALDTHLTAVQRGGADLEAIGAVWLEGTGDLPLLTTALTGPEQPVVSATHDVVVHWEQGPTIAVVTTTLARDDGTAAAVGTVFDVGGDRPRLQLVGPETPATTSDGGDS